LKHDLANTTRLAIDINCAVDRLNTDLKKALDWISTADGLIVNLSDNVQKTVNLTADRLERLNDRVTRLSDEMMVVGGKTETLDVDLEAVNAKVDENIVRLGARIDALANETLEGARVVNQNADKSSADRARLVKLEARLDALVAHLDKGCETMNHNIALLAGAAGFTLENPTADVVTDFPRPPLAEKAAERRARRRIRRAAA
jgi:chromosome segregation ATPase